MLESLDQQSNKIRKQWWCN